MTSTNMFQGIDDGSKPSSRVLRPPGGGSSNIFGSYDADVSTSKRPNKMASMIFAPPDEFKEGPRRSNPPGGKSSGIFAQPEAPGPKNKSVPAGAVTSNIFREPETNQPTVKSHPNKPKDNISVTAEVTPAPAAPQPKEPEEVKETVSSPPATPTKTPPPTETSTKQDAEPSSKQPSEKNHEPRLGPLPRSHNRVLNPPGGKSSVVFY